MTLPPPYEIDSHAVASELREDMTITNTEAVSELLPCPFCGAGNPSLQVNSHAGMSWVACSQCGLEAPSETGVSADDAVNYWNRRAANSAGGVEVKAPRREEQIAAMSVELQKHPSFDDNTVGPLVWAGRLYDAAAKSCITSPAAEPVAWRWTEKDGDTGGVTDREDIAEYAKVKGCDVTALYTHPAPSASREVTDSGLAQRLNNAASIIEQWDAWEIGAANKPTVRLTVSASKLLREAAAALTLPERGI